LPGYGRHVKETGITLLLGDNPEGMGLRADHLMDRDKYIDAVLWVWVVGAMAFYIYQFKGFVRPILNLLGFS
jgi:hypothetical protein